MKGKIENILKDLYSIDPALQDREAELKQAIEVLLSSKPDLQYDESFKMKLRGELIHAFPQTQRYGTVKFSRPLAGTMRFTLRIAAAVAFVFLLFFSPLFFLSRPVKESPRQPSMQNFNHVTAPREQFSHHRLAEKDTAGVISRSSDIPHSGDGELFMPSYNTEAYNRIYENTFLETIKNPLSTFSIDVDTASYANIRRFIRNGQKPYPDAVRIEELINYFSYDYPEPEGESPFSFTTEVSDCPWNGEHDLLHIGLQGRQVPLENLPPGNLVFLIDVSGSMARPAKLPLLKSAFRLLVNELRPCDRVAIVVYAGSAGLVLPSTPGSEKVKIFKALNQLTTGGSTAGGAGIRLAYRIASDNYHAQGNNRVILATDGDFNIGPSSDAEMVRLIEEKRKEGIYLTVLGFGMGNYKDSKMEMLADKGNGNYTYIDSLMEAQKVLVSEMMGTLFTIARDVKIQIEFNPVKVKSYRLIGYENRIMRAEEFNDDTKDAGELGSGHTVTALYEIVSAEGEDAEKNDLKYQTSRVKEEAMKSEELATMKFRYKEPAGDESKLIIHPIMDHKVMLQETSDNFRFAAAVAEWGLLLRDSKFKGSASFSQVLQLARGAIGTDPEGYRMEFMQLSRMTSHMYQDNVSR